MPAELLIHIGDRPGSWQDGDIMFAMREHDALRVRAERLIRGRAEYKGDQLPVLLESYRAVTMDGNNYHHPTEADLLNWWATHDALIGFARDVTYPWQEGERWKYLVVPLTTDITLADKGLWAGKPREAEAADGENPAVPAFKPHRIDWLTDVIGAGRGRRDPGSVAADAADVRDRRIRVNVTPLSLTLVRAPR